MFNILPYGHIMSMCINDNYYLYILTYQEYANALVSFFDCSCLNRRHMHIQYNFVYMNIRIYLLLLR